MPFNGSGTFNRALGPATWQNDAAAGVKIKSDLHDNNDNDIANGLSNVICSDGQTQPTANIPMNGKRITNLANPVNPQDAMTLAQMVASAVRYDIAQALTLPQQLQAHANLAATLQINARSAAYTVVQADRNKLLRIDATCNITLPATTVLGSDWSMSFRTRTGAMTLVPTGTDTIEGQNANFLIPQGMCGSIWCDGAGGYLVSQYAYTKAPTITDILATGSWTRPAGCTHIEVEGCGAGGTGGGTIGVASSAGMGGGGAGGCAGPLGFVIDVSAIGTLACVVAAATAGVAGSTATGGNTQITISGTTYVWRGGGGGAPATATVNGNISNGGAATAPTIITAAGGQNGQNGFATGATGGLTGAGGSSPYGSGGAPERATAIGGGNAGAGYGAGGSGGSYVGSSLGNRAGGNGSQGFIRIKEYYGMRT